MWNSMSIGALRPRLVLLVCGVPLALLLTGCGASSPTAKPAKPAPAQKPSTSSQHGFLATASNGALFIQWTRIGNTVKGTLSEAYTSLADPTQAQSESHSFTGVISGSSITLTLDSGTNWNGTLDGSSVTLSYANSDGSLATFDFRRGSVADYNAAVAQVQGSAGQAQTQQTHDQAVSQARQTIDSDVSAVNSDLQDLDGYLASAKADLAAVPKDLSQESADLATTKTDLARTLRLSSYDLCTQAYTTQSDAYTVQSDVYTINSDGYTLGTDSGGGGDLNSAVSAISSLRSDVAKLTSDRSSLPSYQPQGAPTASEVSSAIASAQNTIAQIRRTFSGYVARAKQMLQTANAYAAQAQAACTKAGG
jgi:hypothetical protein